MEHKKAILIISHGSRSNDAGVEFEKVVELVRGQVEYSLVMGAHMELCEPDIPSVVKDIADTGVAEIIVVPYFLFTGNHIKNDIPEILEEMKLLYPDVSFRFANPIGFEPIMADILIKRIEETDKR